MKTGRITRKCDPDQKRLLVKVWIVYEEMGDSKEKAGRHIYGVFDSEEKAIKYRQDMMKETLSDRQDCIDLEAYEVQRLQAPLDRSRMCNSMLGKLIDNPHSNFILRTF